MVYILPSTQWEQYLKLTILHIIGSIDTTNVVKVNEHTLREFISALVESHIVDLMLWCTPESNNPILNGLPGIPNHNRSFDRLVRAKVRLFPFYAEWINQESAPGHNPYNELLYQVTQKIIDPVEVTISNFIAKHIPEPTWDIHQIESNHGNLTLARGIDYRVHHWNVNRGV